MPPEGSKPSVYASSSPPPAPPVAPPIPPVAPPIPPVAPPAQAPAVVLQAAPAFSPPVPPAPPAPRLAAAGRPARNAAPKSTQSARTAIGPNLVKGHAAGQPAPNSARKASAKAASVTTAEAPEEGDQPEAKKKRPLSKEAKTGIKTAVAVLVSLLALVLISKKASPRMEAYTRLVTAASAEEARSVPTEEKSVAVTKSDIDLLLESTLKPLAPKSPGNPYTALWFATPADDTFVVDATIVGFVINQFKDGRCDPLLLDVLRKRKKSEVVEPLLEYCRTTGNAKAAIAAIKTCNSISPADSFPRLIAIIVFTGDTSIRETAEECAADTLKKSINRQALGDNVIASLVNASGSECKDTLVRLLGYFGGVKASGMVKKSLAASDEKAQIAAVTALGYWPDDTQFETLATYLGSVPEGPQRKIVLDAAIRFLTDPDRKRTNEDKEKYWSLLASNAKSPAEQELLTSGRRGNLLRK